MEYKEVMEKSLNVIEWPSQSAELEPHEHHLSRGLKLIQTLPIQFALSPRLAQEDLM